MNLLLRIPCGFDYQQPCFTLCGVERLLVIPKNMLCVLSKVATQFSKIVNDHLFTGGKHGMDTKRVKGNE